MDLFDTLFGGGISVFAALTLVQIAPITLNPWSWIAKALGRALNGETRDEIAGLRGDIKAVRSQVDELEQVGAERDAKNARTRIVRFGDEMLHGTLHSKDHFDQILMDITEYTTYCAEHPDFKNDVTAITIRRIKDVYAKCLEENSFL